MSWGGDQVDTLFKSKKYTQTYIDFPTDNVLKSEECLLSGFFNSRLFIGIKKKYFLHLIFYCSSFFAHLQTFSIDFIRTYLVKYFSNFKYLTPKHELRRESIKDKNV